MNLAVRKTKTQKQTKRPISNVHSYKSPNIVVVGDKEIRKKIQKVERNFNLLLIFCEPNELKKYINNKTISVIVDEKKVKPKEKQILSKMLKEFNLLPFFYLSRSSKTSNFYKSLYEKGLQGVINWPGEAKFLHDLLIEFLKPHPKAVGQSKGDEKLSSIIKSHLILYGNYKGLKVKVIEGFAFIEGSVRSLIDKYIVELETSKVLGVKKAIVKNIKIRNNKKVTDKELERKIKMYIGHLLGENKNSLSVKVKNKVVTIMGAALNHNDILDIEQFAMKQPGVQDVVRLVKYRPSLVAKNVKKAKLLEKKIKNLFEGVKHISISIYGEYAEVSGTVKLKADRLLIEKYVLQMLPVKKVVNKIFTP